MKALLGRGWRRWKRIAFWIGERRATIIYTLLYVLVIGPMSLIRRPFSDPLGRRLRDRDTFWQPRPQPPATLDEALRQ